MLDLATEEFGQTGLLLQSSWKFLFQSALKRVSRTGNARNRPVFIWEDEAQYFVSDNDYKFQATARDARVAHVLLTQNLHNFYQALGRNSQSAANSLFGNLNTKIFHNNSEPSTNRWAAEQFGMKLRSRFTFSNNPTPPPQDLADSIRSMFDPPNTTSTSATEQWEHAVRPEEFNQLLNGGPNNNFIVEAYITWMGLLTQAGNHFCKVTFQQNPDL